MIGTPGRLKDLMEMEVCRLSEVSFVVCDHFGTITYENLYLLS